MTLTTPFTGLLAMISLTLLVGSGAAVASPRPSPAGEALHVVKESAVYNPSTGLVKFTLKFDRRPNFVDFVDVDGVLRRPVLFQYFIVGGHAWVPAWVGRHRAC